MSVASLKYTAIEALLWIWWIVAIIFTLWYVLQNKVHVYDIKEIQLPNTTVVHNEKNFKVMDKVWYYWDNWPINDWVLKQIVTTKDWTYYDICTWNNNWWDCIKEINENKEWYKCLEFRWSFDNCKSKTVIANSKEELLNCKD
jgi:hypothetical protein